MALATDLEEEENEDQEDDEVRAGDSMIVTAITEDDFSHLEVQLYTEDGTLYVHHDINLPEFPLCLAWLDCPPFRIDGSQTSLGNYVAVGTFDPVIEIWNLDVLDPLEPSASLGGILSKSKNKKTKKKTVHYKDGSHEGAVMALSWNKHFRQALASGSADTTVKIWDVTTQACSHTFTHHSDKVQAVSWHVSDGWLLTSASFDKKVALLDCRSGTTVAEYTLAEDVETLEWNPFDPNQLFCALESGTVVCIDRRYPDATQFQFLAHDSVVTGLSFSAKVPGMMATASTDKTVKVWDVLGEDGGPRSAPKMIAYKSMAVGKLFGLEFCPDEPFVLAAGGDKGMLAIWESDEQVMIEDYFGPRVTRTDDALREDAGEIGQAAVDASKSSPLKGNMEIEEEAIDGGVPSRTKPTKTKVNVEGKKKVANIQSTGSISKAVEPSENTDAWMDEAGAEEKKAIKSTKKSSKNKKK